MAIFLSNRQRCSPRLSMRHVAKVEFELEDRQSAGRKNKVLWQVRFAENTQELRDAQGGDQEF
jgi:hypothetical protein